MRRTFITPATAPRPADASDITDFPPALYVSRPSDLADLALQLKTAMGRDARLCFDTEFIRERTYAPVLEIVQVASGDGSVLALIDVPALRDDLQPLHALFTDPSVLKIVHAGGQDMEILSANMGFVPAPVYDTQVAAAFAGWSLQTGYGALVQAALNVRLDKNEGFSDWSRRPLTDSMKRYAENDVRYLPALHQKLAALLEKRGRTQWAQEQTDRLLERAAEVTAPADLWKRVGGKNILDSRGLAVLRELALWRDDEAQKRNRPRRTTAKDEALIEIAKRLPQTAEAVLDLRGGPPNLGERAAGEIALAVRRGLAVPDKERPRPELPPALDDQGAVLVELLSAVVRALALEENFPAALLASGDELRNLAAVRKKPSLWPESPLFDGWRGAILGDTLRGILTGEKSVAWDGEAGRLTVR